MTKRGLVLGSQIAGLSGVEDDTARVSELLEGYGVAVTRYTGAKASRKGILEAYGQLIADSGPNDVAVLYYSGHGHFALSREDVPGQPRIFQGICPTDYEDSTDTDYRGISSWELSILLRRLTAKTRNAAVILDCCHSSQMSRDGAAHDAVPRALPHPLYLASFGPHIAALRGLYPGELESLDPLGNPEAVRLVACGQTDSRFEYDLTRNANVALFADFATGLAHSSYIAKFIRAANPDATIHLGDVYYSGRSAEVAAFYDSPLSPLVIERELWSIPGNHDYYSGGAPFFKSLDGRHAGYLGGRKHRQEGTYFCLDSPGFRIIAIDGEYHRGTRYDQQLDLQRWLAEKVTEAQSADRTVILLSTDEPYSYDSQRATDLLDDVTASLPPESIDLWFWGNTHYCALFTAMRRYSEGGRCS